MTDEKRKFSAGFMASEIAGVEVASVRRWLGDRLT